MNTTLTVRARRLLLPALSLAVLSGCAAKATAPVSPAELAGLARTAHDFSSIGLARLSHGMSPSMLRLAQSLDRAPHADLWGRPRAWASLDIATPPNLGFSTLLSPEDAQTLNRLLPASLAPSPPASAFVLKAGATERDRALLCLTQAVYYEAGFEPREGQQAVAQVVLNRMRHPAFPKSVCGVVYQGSERVTGCQFTFTCDGALSRTPNPDAWRRAQEVAELALDGFVMKTVGAAVSYHADYVFPRWAPTLAKITQIGAHIFYRFPGPAGSPASLDGRYAGNELAVNMAGSTPPADDGETQMAGAAGSPMVDPTAPNGLRVHQAGDVVFGRRVPTPDEIARINASLARFDRPGAAAPSRPAGPEPAPPGDGTETP